MHVSEVPTPALLLDAAIFESNVTRMAEHARVAGKKLRPHAKAHKCASVAKRQIAAGATGICVATVPEAEYLARAGVRDLLLTSPIADPAKCRRMAAIDANIAVVVDDRRQVHWYFDAAREAGRTVRVLFDLDVGDHRTGIAPGDPALRLAQAIADADSLRFGGIQAYSVSASHMSVAQGMAQFSSEALELARDTKDLIEASGIECPEITGGSTGSYSADLQLPFLTELQAGSYVFMDVAYKKIGIHEFGNALHVAATVISANQPDRVTVDAGFKAFATDRAFGPEVCGVSGARFQWAGDEFGYVFVDRSTVHLELGDRLRFLPPHCDPNVNLYDRIHVFRGDQVEEVWSVMDRYHAR